MSAPVKLSDIIDGMDMQMDESSTYLDKNTGEVSFFTDEEIRAAEDDKSLDDYSEWERESIRKARRFLFDESTSFVPLPTQFDIHEYQIMEEFCYSVTFGSSRKCRAPVVFSQNMATSLICM